MTFKDRVRKYLNYQPEPQQLKKGKTVITRARDLIIDANMTQYQVAIDSARSETWQDRHRLYHIYQNALDFDGHVQACIELRLMNTIGKKLEYVINDKPVDISMLSDSPKFEQFLRDLLMVRFWGIGVFEYFITEYAGRGYFDYQKIPLLNINPYKRVIYTQPYYSGTEIPIKGLIQMLGTPEDLGLLKVISRLAILRRANTSNWANYNELAGDNFMLIKYNEPEDPRERARFRDQMQQRGKNAIVDTVLDAEVSSQSGTTGTIFQTFEQFQQWVTDELSKMILGQTMTTEDGSSRSQAEVHERMQQTIFDNDSEYLLRFLNYEFYEVQSMFGIPEGGRWQFVQSGSLKDKTEIEKDILLKQLGIIFTDEELRKKYGIEPAAADVADGNAPANDSGAGLAEAES